jgi:hypothetical protein
MDQIIERSGDPLRFDLGRMFGRRDALAAISGKCSAAEALTFRRIRDGKEYKALNLTWEECCSKLGVNRRQVERILKLLDEFGPQYFEVARLTHVTVDEYRAIAANISGEGVNLNGAVIALLPENREQVSAAVAELVEREKPAAEEKAPLSLDAIVKRCDALTAALERMTDEVQSLGAMRLTTSISRLRRAAAEKGARL